MRVRPVELTELMESVHDPGKSVPGRKCAVDPVGRIARGIQFMKFIAEHPAGLKSLFRTDLKDLISSRVHDD